MRFLLMNCSNVNRDQTMSEAERGAEWNAYLQYTQEAIAAGVMKGGEGLMPPAMATTVRIRDGKTLATDGPFAETKEQLAGFYILDVENIEQAIQWASKIPAALYGAVEIRPIIEING